MVRIVNGELVPDNDPRLSAPRASAPAPALPQPRRLFPSTRGYFGALSSSQSILGYEVEWFWLLALAVLGLLYGLWYVFVAGILLVLYQNAANSAARKFPQAPTPADNPQTARRANSTGGKFGSLSDVRQDKM